MATLSETLAARTRAQLAAEAPSTMIVSSGGLAHPDSWAAVGAYTEHGTDYAPPPALQTATYTATPAGGAPGAQFGPPGVGSAPVPNMLGLSPMMSLLLLGVAAIVVWKVLE